MWQLSLLWLRGSSCICVGGWLETIISPISLSASSLISCRSYMISVLSCSWSNSSSAIATLWFLSTHSRILDRSSSTGLPFRGAGYPSLIKSSVRREERVLYCQLLMYMALVRVCCSSRWKTCFTQVVFPTPAGPYTKRFSAVLPCGSGFSASAILCISDSLPTGDSGSWFVVR